MSKQTLVEEIRSYCEYQLALKAATPIGYDKIAKLTKAHLNDGGVDPGGGVSAIRRIAEGAVSCGSRGKAGYESILKIAQEITEVAEAARKPKRHIALPRDSRTDIEQPSTE